LSHGRLRARLLQGCSACHHWNLLHGRFLTISTRCCPLGLHIWALEYSGKKGSKLLENAIYFTI
ncbi:uncharacterized protein METZ01_LOCUS193059, partial [marine metagenome]